jgi:hypothetical protein
MSGKSFLANQRKIVTPSGSISYVEQGSGPVALFVHGVLQRAAEFNQELKARWTAPSEQLS